jgi:two-component system chemotaxis response regulator CheY
MRILIVDDSRAMRMIITRTLRQAGFEGHDLVEACNGVEALKVIQEATPDLVLADWNMPEMSGIDLLNELKKANIEVAFGFVTSEATQEMQDLAAEAGAQFFVTKPFTADTLRKALSAYAAR